MLYYFNFIKFINKNSLLMVLPSHSDLDVNCVSLINQYSMGLSNPKTQTMFGILELYDHIMLFLLLILVIKMIFFVNALSTSTQYMPAWQRLSDIHEMWVFDFFCRRIGDNYQRVSRKNKKYFKSYAAILVDPGSRFDIKDVRSEYHEVFYDQLWSFRLLFLKEWYWGYVNKRVYMWNHSPVIEYIWTVFPAIILGLMGVPSFLLLYSLEESAEPVFNISVIGNQWYWTYEYLDFDIHKFFSILVYDRCEGELRNIKESLFNNIYLLNECSGAEKGIVDSGFNFYEIPKIDCEAYFSSFFSEEQVLDSQPVSYPYISDESEVLDNEEFTLADTDSAYIDDHILHLAIKSSLFYFSSLDADHALRLYVEFQESIDSEASLSTDADADAEDVEDAKDYNSINNLIMDLLDRRCKSTGDSDDNTHSETGPRLLGLPFVSYEFNNSFSEVLETLETTISLDSQILPDSDLPLGYPRLLSTDQVLVIPTDTTVRFLVTSNDVIHSRALPSFGIKIDAVPGRINQVVTKTPFFGSTWGQCSESCGVNHGSMPIEIRAMALDDFNFYIKLLIRSIIEPGLDKLFSDSYIKIIFNVS